MVRTLLMAVVCTGFAVGSPIRSVAAEEQPVHASPNEALAALAKDILLRAMPPEFEKKENWGAQSQVDAGWHWVQRDGRWRLETRRRMVNDGLYRSYRVKLIDPQQNLQVRLTKPRPAGEDCTAFSVFLTAKLWTDARQERWHRGVKGLNFHVEAETIVEVRLDVELAVKPMVGGWGSIELLPRVTGVGLRLVKLTLKRLDFIHGDLARELGNATEDIIAGELRKEEAKVATKINAEIKKNREKLRFSPSEVAEIGWDKIRALVGGEEVSE